jgi:CheY-like chemotaxis protein
MLPSVSLRTIEASTRLVAVLEMSLKPTGGVNPDPLLQDASHTNREIIPRILPAQSLEKHFRSAKAIFLRGSGTSDCTSVGINRSEAPNAFSTEELEWLLGMRIRFSLPKVHGASIVQCMHERLLIRRAAWALETFAQSPSASTLTQFRRSVGAVSPSSSQSLHRTIKRGRSEVDPIQIYKCRSKIQGAFMNGNEPDEARPGNASAAPYPAEWRTAVTRSDQLLVRMSYEIRAAVNVILGVTEVIRESELNPNLSHNVGVMRASAEFLLKESAEIIDLTRAELGGLQLCSASFSLHDTLQQAMDLMSILASCKRIRLTCKISRQIPFAVIGDQGRLSQILMTLVRAGIDRLDQGEISVSVERDSNFAEGIKLKFSVADNGRRVSPDRAIFNGGLDQETTTRGGSQPALGLARHLARMMGGDLWAEVEPKVGAVFHFNVNLPAAATVDFLQLSEAGAKVRTDLRPLRILVAEDSVDTLRLIRTFLKEAPWGVESADNGRAAVEMAVGKSYDLILMDLEMPEMNGYIAARQIRISECLNEAPAVPIVALTAHSEAEAAWKSIQAGCTAHVAKPIRKAALLEIIQRYAGDRRQDWVGR